MSDAVAERNDDSLIIRAFSRCWPAGALAQRGTAESEARLLAHVGVAIFRAAFERWTDLPDHADFSACVREATAELASGLGA